MQKIATSEVIIKNLEVGGIHPHHLDAFKIIKPKVMKLFSLPLRVTIFNLRLKVNSGNINLIKGCSV